MGSLSEAFMSHQDLLAFSRKVNKIHPLAVPQRIPVGTAWLPNIWVTSPNSLSLEVHWCCRTGA